ncbi:MAG: hypothetical protein KDA36_12135 [Planctomycetaceae bacterium]|nr:hypothetical protein [Planctomycetaceae bacterium]
MSMQPDPGELLGGVTGIDQILKLLRQGFFVEPNRYLRAILEWNDQPGDSPGILWLRKSERTNLGWSLIA